MLPEQNLDRSLADMTQSNGADLFELAFHTATIGMGILKSNGNWICVNHALCNLLGFNKTELMRRSLASLVYSEDISISMHSFQQLVEGKITSYQLEERYLHKSGRFIWGQLTATRVRLPDGSIVIAGHIQDITRKKAAEEALRRSEALFRTVGENAGDLIFLLDFPSFIIRYASPTVESQLGHQVSQLVGEYSLDLIHPDDRATVFHAVDDVLRETQNGSIAVVRMRAADDSYHYVETHGCTVRSSEGEIERIVVIGRIVDDRLAAEKRLKDSEQRLQLLLDSTAEGIFGLDLQGNFTFCNTACLRILRFQTPNEVLGKNAHDLIHCAHQDGSPYKKKDCPIASTIAQGHSVHVEDEVMWRADGTLFASEYWSRPIVDDGVLIGAVVTFVDITARKAAENELSNAHREAELFINSVPSILIGLDSEGFVKRWNHAAEKTFGVAKNDASGKHFSECGIKWVGNELDSVIRCFSTKTEPVRMDHLKFERNGEERLLGLTLRWIRPFTCENSELLIVGADITERKQSEEELRWKTAFLEAQTNSTGDGILIVDDAGKKLLQNQKLLELFNVPQLISDKNDDKPLFEYIRDCIKNPESFAEKVRYLYAHRDETSLDEIELADGTILERYSSPVLGHAGRYYGRIWTFRDITERKETENMMRQLSLAVEQSPASIVITDLTGTITYVNQKFSESSGYTAEEVLGKKPSILKSGYSSSDDYRQLWATITSGKEWRGILHNRKKSGDLYWESSVIRPIENQQGEISHFLGLNEDITEKLSMEAQLRQAQKLEAIGQLAAGIAHEINTPMQYIGDNTRFLESAWASLEEILSILHSPTQPSVQELDHEILEQLRKACNAADLEYLNHEIPSAIKQSLEGIRRVTKIVQAMKEFSHPGTEEKTPIDINKAIETTITVARNEWKYVAELQTSFAIDLGLVPCHAGQFNQVILNLITNAAHAITQAIQDDPGKKGKITVSTSRIGNHAQIAISDTGAGIPQTIRARVFEPFFTTKEPGRGTGQGLALAHNVIVERHGGTIWFESEEGQGTVFFIRLPLGTEPSQ